MIGLVCISGLFLTIASTAALGANIATCGESAGYGFYPKAGLAAAAQGSGKWINDVISGGRFSLTENEGEFDILVTDAMGRVFSSKQEGGKSNCSRLKRQIAHGGRCLPPVGRDLHVPPKRRRAGRSDLD